MKKVFVALLSLIVSFCFLGLFACGGKVEFKLNFIVEDKIYSTVNTNGEEVIKMPDNPTKVGYSFYGWFWDNGVWEKPFTANSLLDAPLSSDMNVYAKFHDNDAYNVSFETNGGTIVAPIFTSLIKDAPVTSKDFNTLVGWYADSSLNESTKVVFPFEVKQDITLYAKWTIEYSEGLQFALQTTSNSYFITGYTGTEGVLVLPETYNGVAVTGISARAFEGNSMINKIYIPDSIVTVGLGAFSECYSLEKVTMSQNLQLLGASAFSNCVALKEINLPDTLVNIGGEAFFGCIRLERLYLSSQLINIGTNIIRGCNSLKELTIPGNITLISLVGDTIDNIPLGLENIYIASGTTTVVKSAFYDCYMIKELVIPNTVKVIGSYAFFGCSGLTKLTIPTSVEEMEDYALSGLSSVVEVSFEASNLNDLKENNEIFNGIGENTDGVTIVFNGCERIPANILYSTEQNIKHVFVNDNVYSIAQGAFKYSEGVVDFAFYFAGEKKENTENAFITYVFGASFYNDVDDFLPSTLQEIIYLGETIPPYAFAGINKNIEVSISDNTSNIGESAFKNSVCIIRWGDDPIITEISDNSFAGYKGSSITIPDSVTSIGSGAFYGCSNLTEITISDSVTSIGDRAFYNCPIKNATVPALAISYIPISNLKTVIITSGYSIGAQAFYNCSSLESVTIPDSVTSIGRYAFEYCSSLKSVTIPDSVTSIENQAFSGCRSLTSVTIPDSVTSMGGSAFEYCSSLTNIYYTGTASQWASKIDGLYNLMRYGSTDKTLYINNEPLTNVVLEGITDIKPYAFYGCRSLTSVTIGNSVTSIGSDAFSYCSSLTSVTIPDSVTSIEYGAFYNCSSLESITIPDSVTSIGSYAFEYCSSLKSVTIPDSVTSIGYLAFEGCSSLTSIYYTGTASQWASIDGLNNIMSSSRTLYINNEPLTNVVLEGITEIKPYAFRGCSILRSVTIGNSVTSIGDYAISGCSSLTSVTIGNSVTSIGRCAFSDCRNLTSVTIGNSVTSIGGYAFGSCTSLTSVTIPDSVTSIGYYAFNNCSNLSEIIIPASVMSIGDSAFYECRSLTSVYYTGTASQWASKIDGLDNLMAYGSYKTLYINNEPLTNVVLEGITEIKPDAFSYCNNLTSVTIGNSVTSIGSYAFYKCSSLTYVDISKNSNIELGKGLFYNSNNISLVIYSGNENLVSQCSLTKKAVILKSLNIVETEECVYSDNILIRWKKQDDNVTLSRSQFRYVLPFAFRGNDSIKSLIIERGVVVLRGAFYGCNNIESVSIYSSCLTSSFGSIFGVTNIEVGDNLKTLTIHCDSATLGDSFQNLKHITDIYLKEFQFGTAPFKGCSSLINVYSDTTLYYEFSRNYDSHLNTTAVYCRKIQQSENANYLQKDSCHVVRSGFQPVGGGYYYD